MTQKKPKISVVMPFYNREKFLDETVQSVLNQTFEDFEFIAVDDASTDNSGKIVERYAKKDARIKIIQNTKNKGISYSRNRGMKIAQADLIAVVDSDDINMPKRFEKQFVFMQKHPEISIVGTHARVIDGGGEITGEEIKYFTTSEDVDKTFFHLGPFLQPTTMYKKSDILEIGGYRGEYTLIDDMDLYFRLLFCGKQGINIPEFLVNYRRHSGSSGQFSKQRRKVMFRLKREMVKKFKPKMCFADYMSMYVWHILWKIVPERGMMQFEAFIKKIIY